VKRTNRIAAAAVMVFAAAVLFAQAKKSQKIVCEGSTTVFPIAQATAEAFMENNPGVEISVRGGGSGVGAASVAEGTCDIGNMSRAMKDSEMAKAAAKGRKLKGYIVAMDGIAVIVHPSNQITGLTAAQVKDIYTGKISDWSAVGGSGGKIVVLSRDSASGTFEAFGSLALKGAKVRGDALMQASNQAIASMVAKTPGAIGYVGLGYITNEVKAIPINGVMASRETVLSKKFPYSRPLYMYTAAEAGELVKRYINFIKSEDGQKIVEEQGFVGLR